jgi:hypothetical protein
VLAFALSAVALIVAVGVALLIPRRASDPVVPHGYRRLGEAARATAR